MEANLVEKWLRWDPIRWISGALAGLVAAAAAMGVAMFIASSNGFQPTFPMKLFGTIALGNSATDFDLSQGLITGSLLVAILGVILGVAYSHFVYANDLASLLSMGVVWGVFTWIFIWNLFMQSFNTIFAAQIHSTATFPICIAFGLTLVSVTAFDRMFRKF